LIVTYSKPYGLLKGLLEFDVKIGIVSCNSCAKACETGGRKCMEDLSERLKADGFEVVDQDLIPMACNIALVKKPVYDGDILIILACDAGVFCLKKLFPDKKIVAALNTTGLGARDENENIFLMKEF
jgi:hypothetical protein